MEVYLASAAGLLSWCGKWRKIPTPLAHPTLLAACGADVALADSVNRLLYRQGRVSTLPPGVEVLRCWRNQLLTLSSETNCLTLYDEANYIVQQINTFNFLCHIHSPFKKGTVLMPADRLTQAVPFQFIKSV